MAVKIIMHFSPRDPSGQWRAYLGEADTYWLATMTEVQLRTAEAAASKAPHWTGRLANEMFIGGGGNSMVTSKLATVAPGDPYGPQQDQGFHSPPANPDGGKYYSLRDWVLGHGMDESAVFPIAQKLSYSGNDYMARTIPEVHGIVNEEGEKLCHLAWWALGG
jgi:hypothetical protein